MTVLQKRLTRRLPRPIERGEWSVTLDSVGVTFRQTKHRTQFLVSWESVWKRAMEIEAEKTRRERLARRKARKEGGARERGAA